MHIPSALPCPTFQGHFIEDLIRDVMSDRLRPVAEAGPGDLVAIAQSWWVSETYPERSAALGYWRMNADGFLRVDPFRKLPPEHQSDAAMVTAHLLDNIHARSRIGPQIKELHSSQPRFWIDALHTADGILLVPEQFSIDYIRARARHGHLAQAVRFLSQPESSQHARMAARKRVGDFLRAFCGRYLDRMPESDDTILVPGLM